jgi:SulP family sulfate permease
MVVGVFVGVMLSALLFMRRMAEISGTHLVAGPHPQLVAPLPDDVFLYVIEGPLFFGAAEKAVGALLTANAGANVVILDMAAVPVMDVTGLVALQSAIVKLQRAGAYVVLADVQVQPHALLKQAGTTRAPGKLSICRTLAEAETLVRLFLPEHRAARNSSQ